MQKLPEVSYRKKERRMCKEIRTFQRNEEAHSLSGCERRSDNTLLTGGRRHAFVFGWSIGKSFHWQQPSRLTVCRNIKGYEMEQRTKTLDLDKLPKATNHS